MTLDTWYLMVWRDGDTVGIDGRALQWLCQWLTEGEASALVLSLSPQRITWLDSIIREAITP